MIHLKVCNTQPKEILSENGTKVKYTITCKCYSKLNLNTYFYEKTIQLDTDFYFDRYLAKKELQEKFNIAVKNMENKLGFTAEFSDMEPERFERVFDIVRL